MLGIFAVNTDGPIDHLVFILLNFIGNLFHQPSFIMFLLHFMVLVKKGSSECLFVAE